MTVKEKRNNRKKKQSTIKKAFDTVKDKRILYTAAVFLAVVILLATLYLGYSWDRYGRNAEKEAIALSESLMRTSVDIRRTYEIRPTLKTMITIL